MIRMSLTKDVKDGLEYILTRSENPQELGNELIEVINKYTRQKSVLKTTGIDLITIERNEQINKHGRTIDYDVKNNKRGQLAKGAASLIHYQLLLRETTPDGWDEDSFIKMKLKDHKDRLVIAGALIAAEIDRVSIAVK
jgi:hypothetical protein